MRGVTRLVTRLPRRDATAHPSPQRWVGLLGCSFRLPCRCVHGAGRSDATPAAGAATGTMPRMQTEQASKPSQDAGEPVKWEEPLTELRAMSIDGAAAASVEAKARAILTAAAEAGRRETQEAVVRWLHEGGHEVRARHFEPWVAALVARQRKARHQGRRNVDRYSFLRQQHQPSADRAARWPADRQSLVDASSVSLASDNGDNGDMTPAQVWHEVRHWVSLMGELGVNPSPKLITMQLNAISRSTLAGSGVLAMEVLTKWISGGGQPNIKHYNAALHACAMVGDQSSAWVLLRMMWSTMLIPNAVTWNTLLLLGSRASPTPVKKRAELKRRRIDAATQGDAQVDPASGPEGSVEGAHDVFLDSSAPGDSGSDGFAWADTQGEGEGEVSGASTYAPHPGSAASHASYGTDRFPILGLVNTVVEGRQLQGLGMDSHSYNTLVVAYAKARRPDLALSTLRHMRRLGFDWVPGTATSLTSAWCREKQPAQAATTLRMADESGFPPLAHLYLLVARTFGKYGDATAERHWMRNYERVKHMSTTTTPRKQSRKGQGGHVTSNQ